MCCQLLIITMLIYECFIVSTDSLKLYSLVLGGREYWDNGLLPTFVSK